MKPDYDPGNPDHVHHDCHRGAGCQVPGEDCQTPDVDADDELELTGQELIADHRGTCPACGQTPGTTEPHALDCSHCGAERPSGPHGNDDARALLAEMDGARPR